MDTLIARNQSEINIIERALKSLSNPITKEYWERRLQQLNDELKMIKDKAKDS
jgi:predicted  nucleic acid-binding Zn-ribbon protein